MADDGAPSLRVAVFASRELDTAALRELERRQHLVVVGQYRCEETEYARLADADVVLVELGQETRRDDVTRLLEQVARPVLLHSGPVTLHALLDTQLVRKLRELGSHPEQAPPVGRMAKEPPAVSWVVALCASVGGPKAIGRFLAALPEDAGVVFLVVQHMAKEFQPLLASQLARVTRLRVQVMKGDDVLDPDIVWVVPADRRIAISGGRVNLTDANWSGPNRPSMNEVLEMLARDYGGRCGVILFSGVGSDGLSGGEAIRRHGGFVWAQEPASCVVAGLPDAARSAGLVDLSDTPEALAAAVSRQCASEGRAPF